MTGEIEARKMTAIIGPSGAGKTTFMNVLMGKLNRTSGTLFINGLESEMHFYKKIIGYVPQDDVMITHLSVRENVLHSARMRLPGNWKPKEIETHVDSVLKALNLTSVANTLIGDENSRGVSGGQRKRVNIAMELAAAPLAIFLDEPTSGLDSTSALDVADILSNIASIGLTIVAVIHQPRIEIFHKFDNVLMIAPGGRMAYAGPVIHVKQYFQNLGFIFDAAVNESDVLMDILAGKARNDKYSLTPSQLVTLWEDINSKDSFVFPDVDASLNRPNSNPDLFNNASQNRPDFNNHHNTYLSHSNPNLLINASLNMRSSNTNGFNNNSTLRPSDLRLDRFCSPSADDDHSVFEIELVNRRNTAQSEDFYGVNTQAVAIQNVNSARSSSPALYDTRSLTNRSIRSLRFSNAPTVTNESERNRDREFHINVAQVVRERGAKFWRQVYYCHQRSLLQQSRQMSALVMEIVVAMFAGLLMGVSTQGKVKELFTGVYYGEYIALSPAPLDLVSLYGLLIGISIALAGAPAGVKVFGEEKPVFWREAAAGHSRLAYYLGKTFATLYRLILTSLHFTGLYVMLARPVLSPMIQYSVVLLQFWGVYGISCIVSLVVRRENASLLSVVVCLFCAVFCGYGPSLTQAHKWGLGWLFELSFNKWAAEAQWSITIYRNKYDIDAMALVYGYSLHQVTLDLVMCFVLGLLSRVVGFLLLVLLNKDKQR